MIVQFTVRSGQGDPSGFDLGDMFWSGDLGEASSAGHVPDQGMMIYLSVTQLLDCLHGLLNGEATTVSFNGIDTSFALDFRMVKRGIKVASRSEPVALTSRAELATTVLSAAEELARATLSALPRHDGARDDYEAALNRFRTTANAQ